MVIDTSALIAVALREPGWEDLAHLMAAEECAMSAATWVELGIASARMGAAAAEQVDVIVDAIAPQIIPVSVRQAEMARLAHRRFGRGSGSPARLNYGDCFSYALAIERMDTLLYVGEDFVHTDVISALR
ncbi:MAG TPA: type II toxin-antitoxin system VapC family toxin [Actinomycetales bacterium]|nr:type II toxin-antitoxin system VapC family toxin [Actinomycetales bacterium]